METLTKSKYPVYGENFNYPEIEISPFSGEIKKRFNHVLELSGLNKINCCIETWTSSASNKALGYLTHGLFRYYGKFPPPVARHLIKNYTNKNELIIDPMCGSGTSALEASLLGRKAICFDVNPLSTLLAKVKVTRIEAFEFENCLLRLTSRLKSTKPPKIETTLIGFKNSEHWFLKETIYSLAHIKDEIKRLKSSVHIKDAFMLLLLSSVRRVSRATSQQGRLFLDVDSAEKDAVPFFLKKAEKYSSVFELLPKKIDVTIKQVSISDHLNISPKITNLVICHPPYFNSYKYSSVFSLELALMGQNHADIRKTEVREAFKVGKFEKVNHYLDDMEKVLTNCHTLLKKNGVLALMIGDTFMKGRYIPVTKMLLERFKRKYFIEKVALRIPQFTEASWATSQRRGTLSIGINICDFVLMLRKK